VCRIGINVTEKKKRKKRGRSTALPRAERRSEGDVETFSLTGTSEKKKKKDTKDSIIFRARKRKGKKGGSTHLTPYQPSRKKREKIVHIHLPIQVLREKEKKGKRRGRMLRNVLANLTWRTLRNKERKKRKKGGEAVTQLREGREKGKERP